MKNNERKQYTFYSNDNAVECDNISVYCEPQELKELIDDDELDGCVYEYRLVAIHKRSGWTREEVK